MARIGSLHTALRYNLIYLVLSVILTAYAGGCAHGDPSSVCGNGILEPGEECDGTDIGKATCSQLGYPDSTALPGCTSECTLDPTPCRESCSDECTPGLTMCDGNTVMECVDDGGCARWTESRDCQSKDLVCDESLGSAICTDHCSDTCDTQGDVRCSGSTVQECRAIGNGCLGWRDAEDCAGHDMLCDGGKCVCPPDQCSQGQMRCTADRDQVEQCLLQISGCTAWEVKEDCAGQDEICVEDATNASCIPVCDDFCTEEGQTRCSGDMIQTCTPDASGCPAWTDTQDCAASGMTCDSGSCVCVNQCSQDGQTQCSGDTVQTCTADGNGCLHWTDSQDCGADGKLCSSGQCVPYYTRTNLSPGGYSPISGSTKLTDYDDDGYYRVNLPFTFTFYGQNYTTIWVSTNGWISFGSDPGTYIEHNTSSLPDSQAPHEAIYPFWDDLSFRDSDSRSDMLHYVVQGTAPNRVLVVEWLHALHYEENTLNTADITIQVRLHEGSNIIEFLYDRAHWRSDNLSATVGIESDSLHQAILIGSNFTSAPSDDYRFTPNF